FKFLRSGIRFEDLSDEEKIEFAEKFRDDTTGMIPRQIDGKAVNQWLFNVDTIDQTISLLMQQGLKVDGGDYLGKTIIFARNHDHAELIVERFNRNYPQYCGKFAQLIDSSEVSAQNILNDFSIKDKFPIIAVSVDMLDTGVDIPEVLNLVFFKPVYSPIKFWQMIGRGTRLCPNLFGFEQDKKEFLIFDLCGNFEFFSQKIAEKESKITASLTGRIFNNRLKLSQKLPDSGLKSAILDELNSQVSYMNETNVLVRPYLQDIEFYRQRENWNNLSSDQIEKITPLGELPTEKELGDRMAKEFDLICVNLQLTLLQQSKSFNYWRNKVQNLMDGLAEKQTIPMIKNKISLITEVRSDGWWEDVTLEMIEEIRLELREIIKFVSREQEKIIYTNFEDSLGEITEIDLSSVHSGLTDIQYKKRVEQYIISQENNIVIGKIKRNLPLTETDLETLENLLFTAKVVENRERFEDVFGNNKGLKQLIRELVKLDREVVKSAFSKYLDGTKFKETQIKFVELIADYLTQRGVMNAEQLYEMPFTNLHYQGVEGLFNDGEVDDLINIIESFNYTVEN
ncbi:MAG TPA: type I restriction-modification enzyme R subunit C-terminal domain-containing protein, partial [Allocoleopsis sp.]